MDIHRQTCQKCGSRQMRNLLVRDLGSKDKVYVQCSSCRELVARYIVATQGYYHHNKGFESYVKGLQRGGEFMSGRDLHQQFDQTKIECEAEFLEVLKRLEELKKTD